MTPSELNEYANLILMPVAMAWRGQFLKSKQPCVMIKNHYSCRVKFSNKAVEEQWQAFCRTHSLKNEETLEY